MPAVLAVAAHPDDIEFGMAGTMLLLRQAGWDLHYLNLSNGNLGSTILTAPQTARVRRKEAQAAARLLGAKWHPPFGQDLCLFYTEENIRRLCAVVRAVQPAVILTHALADYMEDHMITARLTVTGAFARGIPNFRSQPARRPSLEPCVLYHAMPHGLTDPLRRPVFPDCYVDTTAVLPAKRAALACHASQREWLDRTQGMDSYLATMEAQSAELGRRSKKFRHAEGWTAHAHYGFGSEQANPLAETLGKNFRSSPSSR